MNLAVFDYYGRSFAIVSQSHARAAKLTLVYSQKIPAACGVVENHSYEYSHSVLTWSNFMFTLMNYSIIDLIRYQLNMNNEERK